MNEALTPQSQAFATVVILRFVVEAGKPEADLFGLRLPVVAGGVISPHLPA